MSREFLFSYQLELQPGTTNEYVIVKGLGAADVTDISDSSGDDTNVLGDVSDDQFAVNNQNEVYSGYGTALFASGNTSSAGPIGTHNGILTLYSQQDLSNGTLIQLQSTEPGQSGANQFNLVTSEPAACYCTGTLISTVRGDIAVEDLVIGDLLPTLHGGARPIRWIGNRSFVGSDVAGKFLALPICIKAGAISDSVPSRDLYVSPGHAIHVDGVLIHAYRLLNGASVLQAEAVESVTYWHVELDSHEVIFAEDCPAESFLDIGNRDWFAPSTANGSPGDVGQPCLPLLVQGHQLDAICARIAARAGIAPRVDGPIGALQGYIDRIEDHVIYGWAFDVDRPDHPVNLNIAVNGRRVARILANSYRGDIRSLGASQGFCGFEVKLSANTSMSDVIVTRATDGTQLKLTHELSLQAA